MTSQKSILVVDDEGFLRRSLSLVLQKGGYQVETADHGERALEHLHKRPFDLIFLDLNMPGMSGIELLAEIHQRYPRLPVLILTAHATLESAIQAVRMGARDYPLKPMDPLVILARVTEVLAQTEQPDRQREIVTQLQNQLQNFLAELQQLEETTYTPPNPPDAPPFAESVRFLQKGPFALDLYARHATLNNQYLPITGIYFDYFATLLRHAPKTVPIKTLVKESQGYEVVEAEARDLGRWRVHELRRIIEPDVEKPQYILTVRGVGYRLVI